MWSSASLGRRSSRFWSTRVALIGDCCSKTRFRVDQRVLGLQMWSKIGCITTILRYCFTSPYSTNNLHVVSANNKTVIEKETSNVRLTWLWSLTTPSSCLKPKNFQTRLEEFFGGTKPVSLTRWSQTSEKMGESVLPAAIVFYKTASITTNHVCGCKLLMRMHD